MLMLPTKTVAPALQFIGIKTTKEAPGVKVIVNKTLKAFRTDYRNI